MGGFGFAVAKQIYLIMIKKEPGNKYQKLAFVFFNFFLFLITLENIWTYPQELSERILLLLCAFITVMAYKGSQFNFLNPAVLFKNKSAEIGTKENPVTVTIKENPVSVIIKEKK